MIDCNHPAWFREVDVHLKCRFEVDAGGPAPIVVFTAKFDYMFSSWMVQVVDHAWDWEALNGRLAKDIRPALVALVDAFDARRAELAQHITSGWDASSRKYGNEMLNCMTTWCEKAPLATVRIVPGKP